MNTCERFQAVINFRPFDRLPILEWAGWWNLTVARWSQEGLPPSLTERYEICRHFGLDIARLRSAHPRLRFIGHFNKMTMNKGAAVMRAEFERLLPTAAAGGFLISCDHQTPPDVSYRDY